MAKEKMEVLVPAEEQPYEVPNNWRWVRLEGINHYDSMSILPDSFPSEYFELYSVPSYDNQYPEIVAGRDIGSNKMIVEEGDVLLCKINPKINRVWQVVKYTDNMLIASSEWIIIRNKTYNPSYLMYCFQSAYFREYMLSNVSGVGGSLMRAQPKFVKQYPVPVPPVKEQERIVNSINSLFAKLDEAKEKAQAVVDGYEERRVALLHKAFTGELTEKWRNEHNVPYSWQTVEFDDVADIKSNLVDPADYQEYPHIAPDNIEKMTGKLLEYHTIAEDKVTSGKHLFHSGQILYSKIRPYLSKVVVVDFDGLCSADMYPIVPKDNMVTKFLWYYMLSDDFLLQASSAGSRSVLPKINQKEMSVLKVRIAGKDEQEEVVRVLGKEMLSLQRTRDIAEEAIEQIEIMKKSILAKAFRGELGTNDPSEPPVELS